MYIGVEPFTGAWGSYQCSYFQKRTILSQQLSTANSFPVRGGAWKSSTTSLLDFWLLDRVQAATAAVSSQVRWSSLSSLQDTESHSPPPHLPALPFFLLLLPRYPLSLSWGWGIDTDAPFRTDHSVSSS